jgi:hypothetical protein
MVDPSPEKDIADVGGRGKGLGWKCEEEHCGGLKLSM